MPGPPYATNSELYADPKLTEGIDWARRFRRHERFDDSPARTDGGTRAVILAPHGGGIERGTSELCLAVAGYHPANLPITPPAGVTYDYWMFEGIREAGNADLHVTSTGCDDLVAVSLCAGALGALSLHGFKPENVHRPPDEQVVFVGGCDDLLRPLLLEALDDVDLPVEAAGDGELDGDSVCNIVNRTLRGRGAQLGAQRAAARHDVRQEHPPGPEAHHHRGVLDLRDRLPGRARPLRGRAGHRQPGRWMPTQPGRSMSRAVGERAPVAVGGAVGLEVTGRAPQRQHMFTVPAPTVVSGGTWRCRWRPWPAR
jgi:phage replication-related protein YjqB (UPF0714/DUF867 family)